MNILVIIRTFNCLDFEEKQSLLEQIPFKISGSEFVNDYQYIKQLDETIELISVKNTDTRSHLNDSSKSALFKHDPVTIIKRRTKIKDQYKVTAKL
ncbi:hypothetical protein AYI70_g3840 [Smittium culicis]|uniref:Uncharacterized protein n=1 Tax=Smittium culicis TaxID=133412 RepID=A0A1R1Y222_9FUNG|nr:hypothetical protein AYI70_g3840 [Smittium culicis]